MGVRKIVYFVGLSLLVVGMPLSTAMMSIGDMIIFGAWLFDRNLIQKTKSFLNNKVALTLSVLFLLHVFGLAYTTNFNYAYDDLRTKVPLLIFPLVFCTMPSFTSKEIRYILYLFVLAVLFSLSTSFFILYTKELSDSRMAFPFGSHIRIGILAYLSICILLFYSFFSPLPTNKFRIVTHLGIVLILTTLMLGLELMSAWILVLSSALILLFIAIFKSYKLKTKIIFSSITLVLLILGFTYIFQLTKNYRNAPEITLKSLPKITNNGGVYQHLLKDYPIENGSYIGSYMCRDELKSTWNERSSMQFDSCDKSGQPIEFTILRYLNSKKLTKDREGVLSLKTEDIKNIENGIANINYIGGIGFKKKLFKILWELSLYETKGDIKGQSIFQRFELWKTSIKIIADHPIFGNGTGDVPDVFHAKLLEEKSLLADSKMRSHNQFLSITIAFGLVGLVIFLVALLYPLSYKLVRSDFLYLSFILALLLSMLWEDTLETQLGLTIFAFFNAFYLFQHLQIQKQKSKN